MDTNSTAPQVAQNAVLVRSEDLEGKCPKVVGYVDLIVAVYVMLLERELTHD